MFRNAAVLRLLSRSGKSIRRGYATDLPAATEGDEAFISAWKKAIPNIDPPKTPSAYFKPRPSIPTTIPSKLTVNFVLPYSSALSKKEVDMVIVPTSTGQMGILPGYVPTITELKAGLLTVHEGNDIKKYVVSSGFAFIHANSVTDIIAVEAVPVEQIDQAGVQKGLAEATQKLSSASTDLEKAEAQIAVDVLTSLNLAVSS